MEIKSTKNYAYENGIKLLVYGEAGSGKTRLCATTGGTPLILSAESGLLSLSECNLDYIEVDSIETLREAYTFALNSKDAKKYDWICLDSISEIAEVCMSSLKKKYSDPKYTFKIWGDLADTMILLIKSFRDLSEMNVYMSSKSECEKDDVANVFHYTPSLPGKKLKNDIDYLFDEVFFLSKVIDDEKKVKSMLHTKDGFNFRAKDRSGALDLIEEPNLKKIHDKIKGHLVND